MRSVHAAALIASSVTGLASSLAELELAAAAARAAGDEDLHALAQRFAIALQILAERFGRQTRAAVALADHAFVPKPVSPYCATCPRTADYHPEAAR